MASDAEILAAYREIPENASLPREGPCFFFYENLTDIPMSLLVRDACGSTVFYLDHEEFLDMIDPAKVAWHIETGERTGIILIVNPGGPDSFNISWVINPAAVRDRDFLDELKSTGRLTLSLLSFEYGDFIKKRTILLDVPGDIAGSIP